MTETTIQPQNKNAKPTIHGKMLYKPEKPGEVVHTFNACQHRGRSRRLSEFRPTRST